MNFNNIYYKQVELLLDIMPFVSDLDSIAMKGGTAINFFIRNLPRLSIDIDLVYTKISNRKDSLKEIDNILEILSKKIKQNNKIYKINKGERKLIISKEFITVKVEINTIIRGNIYSIEEKETREYISEEFHKKIFAKLLSFEEIYAGKICAALDRQHPRDLFDIKLLFENEGINEKMRKALLILILSHNRPINELLKPNEIDIKQSFENEFNGMSRIDITIDDLNKVRRKLFNKMPNIFNKKEKEFIISVKEGNPQYNLIDLEIIKDFPAFKWKLQNIKRISIKKRKQLVKKLIDILNI